MRRLVISIFAVTVIFSLHAFAATYTVTNCANSGAGSLRQAITNASSSGDEIVFDITTAEAGYSTGEAGPGLVTNEAGSNTWFRIMLDSALSNVSVANVKIRGSTQTREASNAIGPNVEVRANGTFSLFICTADGITVEGLVLNRRGGSDGGTGVQLNGASNCHVYGNYIGTTASGEALAPNRNLLGIYVFSSGNNNTIGGTTSAESNVICGNSDYGIRIASSSSNEVLGNYIGVDRNGESDLGNLKGGLRIQGSYNVIGNGAASGRNIISGNDESGIDFVGASASANRVIGNYIGTNQGGAVGLANNVGISIESGALNNQIGDGTTGGRNIISGNTTVGIVIDGSGTNGNEVKGNFIGTNVTGGAALANSDYGVQISNGAQNNIIGSSTTGEGNVISGNGDSVAEAGVYIKNSGTSSNEVLGNIIGLNSSGTAALANSGQGIFIEQGATFNSIGSSTAGGRNIISGNTRSGIYLDDAGTNYTRVVGNYIGTNMAGTVDLGNSYYGIFIYYAEYNQIGDGTSGGRNIISGNNRHGISIDRSSTNEVFGNFIGTDVTGTLDLGNSQIGVALGLNCVNNKIGSSTAGTGNIISGNGRWGVYLGGSLASPCNSNEVTGNYIGTDATATADLGNDRSGVWGDGYTSFTRVGTGNIIAYNGNASYPGGGVFEGVNATSNRITYNLIYGNYDRGIILQNGANGNIATPEVLSAGYDEFTGLTQITGESAPAFGTIEVYKAENGQAKTYLTTTLANASGQFSFSASGLASGDAVVVTGTSAEGSTSELSLAFTVTTAVARQYQPDNMIATLEAGTDYVGEGIYNTDGTNQTRTRTISTGASATYYIKIKNAGNTTYEVTVTGTGSNSSWGVAYYDAASGGNNITSQVIGSGWTTAALASQETKEIRLVVTSTGETLATFEALVTSTATPDSSAKDAVKATTTAVSSTDLSSFTVSASSTAIAGTAFSATITGKNSSGGTETVIVGRTSVEVDDGTITPTSIESSAFSSGVWTGGLTLSKPGSRTITISNGTAEGTAVVLVSNATQEFNSTDLGVPGMSITIPQGATTAEVSITVSQVTSPGDAPAGYQVGGNVFDIVATPSTFSVPVTVTIPISGPLADPRVYYWTGSAWSSDGITIISVTDTSITFTTTHFTIFAPMGALSTNLVRFGPNPYNANSTTAAKIWYWLSADAETSIYVVNMTGTLVWKNTYASGSNGGRTGSNSIDFDGKDRWGSTLGNGVYIYKIVQGGKSIGGGRIAIIKQ